MRKLVGFTGRARVGKDTAATVVIEKYDGHRYAFADPIREMLRCIGVSADSVYDKEAPIAPYGKSLREMMQTLGTEWGRNLIHSDIWLIAARHRIEWLLTSGACVVLSDVRFDNEAAFIKSLGGVVIEIIRPEIEEQVREHVSENGVSTHLVDRMVFNDCKLEVFKERIYDLV